MTDAEEATTRGGAEVEAFETERAHLLTEIVQGLRDATSEMRKLNRNMEHVVEIGKGFERSAVLWEAFCKDLK
eukprot:CAMPEP_0171504446 /NCGR_PEP_ID=MMETSP0958-20121227/11591_1 /TAXON_ID=87120 /ORGANISM="Aurantiochytrium limacinum, Strain ATCCMYA-1381" /LENGTH=72 /DNA_ID=CAMNT_0012040319 /DNA_START=18 /DNA_END=236 /DNA_ORIENTATION=-